MTSSVVPPSAAAFPISTAPKEKARLPLVQQLLREQQTLTAVERFAQHHEHARVPAGERRYRDLLPTTPLSSRQQYAFEVDLDACTGCKACVTACHNLNGLDEGEAWRAVGLLHGGTAAAPVQQTVTSACHHCLEPACMHGCPVLAYEKDPVTGIVKHLDDQCIGCQYCTFTCPYDVPQYNASRGIVRKCDMCSDRLAVGEAPACVQACPNEAIAITAIDRRQAIEDAQGDAFVPGAPSPGITIPTTVYKTTRALPRNLLPANFYAVKPSHHHVPLVVMLVLTQLSVGAFCVADLAARLFPIPIESAMGQVHALVALSLGLAALGASVLHLGRPLYAFRALLGLKTSWMSREILAFGLFALLATMYAVSFFRPSSAMAVRARDVLSLGVAVSGVAGVICSALIYHATRRAWWSAPPTASKFFLTAAILGIATTSLTLAVSAGRFGGSTQLAAFEAMATGLVYALIGACVVKAIVELLPLRHLRERRYTELKRSALLLSRDLRPYMTARLILLVAGIAVAACQLGHPLSIVGAFGVLVLLLGGELLERTLFFAAVSSPGMPGGLA